MIRVIEQFGHTIKKYWSGGFFTTEVHALCGPATPSRVRKGVVDAEPEPPSRGSHPYASVRSERAVHVGRRRKRTTESVAPRSATPRRSFSNSEPDKKCSSAPCDPHLAIIIFTNSS